MRFLAVIGALAIVVAIGAAVFFFGGFYRVAWVLVHVRQASVDRHATEGPLISLDDTAVVRAGAHTFDTRGCTNCHGAPGVKWAKFTEGMQPYPPDLKEIVNDREPRQLFWVIKNGIKMTAMPSFGAIGVPDQEIWSIVAFLKKLPTVSEEDFKTWSAPTGAQPGGNP